MFHSLSSRPFSSRCMQLPDHISCWRRAVQIPYSVIIYDDGLFAGVEGNCFFLFFDCKCPSVNEKGKSIHSTCAKRTFVIYNTFFKKVLKHLISTCGQQTKILCSASTSLSFRSSITFPLEAKSGNTHTRLPLLLEYHTPTWVTAVISEAKS